MLTFSSPLNISLTDSIVTPNHVVKITCAVEPDLYDKFILTANVIDRLSRCDVLVSQAQVNDVADVVNTPMLC